MNRYCLVEAKKLLYTISTKVSKMVNKSTKDSLFGAVKKEGRQSSKFSLALFQGMSSILVLNGCGFNERYLPKNFNITSGIAQEISKPPH